MPYECRKTLSVVANSFALGGIWLLLAVFVLLGCVYAVVTPLFEVSDELWHYPMVKTLADGNGLPVQDPANPGPWRQEGSQPPLYYAVMALATAWIDTSDMDQVRWINPHADNGLITLDGNNNIIIHTDRERWPWTGTVLAVRLIRLLSVLLGAATVYFTYRLALEVRPGQAGLALAAAGLVAFTPMFIFISASVNNDNLAITLSTAALWLLARWLRHPESLTWKTAAVMGLLLGGAALSKTSALGLWGLAGVVYLCMLRPSSFVFRHAFSVAVLGAITFTLAALTSGWWFLRNYNLYGDWLGWNAFLATVGARPHPASLVQLWGERVGFVQAYWGLFGGVSVAMPDWIYLALNVMAAAAGLGAVAAGVTALLRRRVNPVDAALWALSAGWLALILAGLVRWTSLTWASQGRLIFPAIAAVGLLLAAGLRFWHRWLPGVVIGGMALLTAALPFVLIRPHYAPPPALTEAELAAISQRVGGGGAGMSFGGEMRLLGYDLLDGAAQPGEALRLRLYWQSEIAMDRNWSIFAHVVDEAGVIVAQRDRYPGNGALATTLLSPGQTWADDYVIPIPDATYAPTAAHIVVGLYDLADGARPLVADGSDALTLAPVQIEARPPVMLRGVGEVPNPFGQNFGNQIELVGYDMDRRALRPGETLRLTLYWRAIGEIPLNYSVFAHVRGEGESLWGGQDAWPQQGAAPTSAWRLGEVLVDPYDLTVKPESPPGLYDVEVGLYDGPTLERLRVYADDGRLTDADFVFLSRIRVLP